MGKKFTLFWSKGQKTYVLRRPGAASIKFGNTVPLGVIQKQAADEAKKANAQLVIREDR